MGDGGVACMPLQHNSIMDRLSAPEKTHCGGGSNESNGNNGFSSKPLKLAESEPKKKKKIKRVIKRVITVRKGDTLKSEVTAARKGSSSDKVIKNGEIFTNKSQQQNDEVEEGELGTLKWPVKEVENGEITSENSQRIETEKEAIVVEQWKPREREKEKEDSTSNKSREPEKGEITPEKGWRGDLERGEFRPWRSSNDEIEKGEFIPDRWQRSEFVGDDSSYSKSHSRYDSGKDKSWRHDLERTPPLGKYLGNDISRRKDLSRSAGNQHSKDFYRWENGLERNVRLSSKIVDEDGSYRDDHSNGKNQRREYISGNRLKRHSAHDADSDGSDRDHDQEHDRKHHSAYSISKSRKISDDGARLVSSDHHSRRSPDRLHRNSSSFSRISSIDKHTSRHPESSSSSRGFYDRGTRSPVYSERGPRDRPRQNDHRDRSPVHRERSPYVRDKSPYHPRRIPFSREKSPHGRDRSPHGRERTPHGRERTPHGRDRSPHDRSYHSDRKHKSPVPAERSQQDRSRCHDKRDQNQVSKERPAQDRVKSNDNRDASRKSGSSEKLSSRAKSNVSEQEKQNKVVSSEKDAIPCPTDSQCKITVEDVKGPSPSEKVGESEPHTDDPIESPAVSCKNAPHVGEALPEDLQSMEEDMDICDTPPHVPVVADSTAGKWVYFDYYGAECGPSQLCELKALVEEGVLCSDHFIKHLDSDRWVTVENASSPLVTLSFPSIVPESVTQLVSPPEAPGNLMADKGDTVQPVEDVMNPVVDFCLDERIAALLQGFTLAPGTEFEVIREALQMTFDHEQWDNWGNFEGLMWHQACIAELYNQKIDETSSYQLVPFPEPREMTIPDQDLLWAACESGNWFPGQCSCKGGDWKRNEETTQDRFLRRKVVLNDGFPLCLMPKSSLEDPRWLHKDELYHPSQNRRLDLPSWAFSMPEEKSDGDGVGKSLPKPVVPRGVRGTMLPVVRINACVVKDQDSSASESRNRTRGKERHSSRTGRTQSNSELRCSVERDSRSRSVEEEPPRSSRKAVAAINTPKDRVCTVQDLQLHLGDWYYLDGTGRERGPSSISELQSLVNQGIIPKNSSVFRKYDKLWIPVTSGYETSEAIKLHRTTNVSSSSSCRPTPQLQSSSFEQNHATGSFLNMHPQFIGFMRGKLHELVMRSYKSREFAAAINEVLDPWINAKQPKRDTEKHIYRKSDAYLHTSKRARLSVEESEEDSEMEGVMHTINSNELSFEELCHNATFSPEGSRPLDSAVGSWDLLDGHVLARVFHFLRSDIRSHIVASSTCRRWRAASRFYRTVARHFDLSSLGASCTDSVIRSIMDGFNKANISSMVLTGCSNISPNALEDIIHSCPCLSYIDIRGCSQFAELTLRYPNLNWVRSRQKFRNANSRVKSLKQLTESSLNSASMGGDVDELSELKDYFASIDRRDSAGQSFRRGFYKRSKVFGARKALSIISRDARVRRWDSKKSEKGYKRMEEFLVASLKEIMKENTFEFFVPKVAYIENRIKSGYYIHRGVGSIKEDISRMCRDAIKAKSRGDAGDMNRIVTLFIQLASSLEDSSKSSFQKDEIIKSWRDDSSAGSSASSKYRNKTHRVENDKRYTHRSNGSSQNGVHDGEYASDREIRRRLSKLNRRSADSESETSDEFDFSSGMTRSEGETSSSETESDLGSKVESRTAESRADGFFGEDEGLESLVDDREWGARMTKASLVPPVTRKYEVIDRYLIVADEENVKSKMQVALPEDYSEKLDALNNGTEDLDLELPEVKDYKPRKQPGNEVIEQEVYGIDPYTHNLLLDSMPEGLDWSLSDKHWFIEDVLLCTLNKQVRNFTGKGNTPMMYPLQPVIEEVERTADDSHDLRTVRMCQGILRAIDSRPEDKYVAYRKGLGVVCNKEGGFGEDDFIVEFLGEVYPTWRWFEKQDGIRSLQKNSKDPAPEFYNIYLERPKGDADGYDLVVVDAMHKANYASRICHSCKPNCEAKVTAVDGQYQIGIYSVRKIQYGEEITFDYNSVTESKEEYEASVCLCGSQICRGSYLNLTGEGAFQKVLKDWHGTLDRYQLMVEACETASVSEEDYYDLGRAGLGSCLLGALPDWLVAYAARLVRFINFERTKLPKEILKHNLEEKRKYFLDISLENEKSDAEVQAEGVYNQRLQNLAITLDKVTYVMRCVFGDPKKAPPPLERLSPEEAVSAIWSREGSLVDELLDCIAPHMDGQMLKELKSKIQKHDPSGSDDLQKSFKKSLLWLRDEVRDLPCTQKCRNDAAADLIHIYAHTKCYFRIREYKAVTSPPVFISPLDLGPKYSDKLGEGGHEYCKTYGENYCLGQLILWHLQTNSEPDVTLFRISRGCLSLPDVGSFYAKPQKASRQRVYGPRTVRFMAARMEKLPQRPWPKDRIWSFKDSPKILGSPMLDSVLKNSPLDREMVHWLKNRTSVFHAVWDQ